ATIIDDSAPVINEVTVVEPDCGATNGSITIHAVGTSTLLYSLNGTTYVESNVFQPLAPGSYTVYVRDLNNCIATAIVIINTTDGPQIDDLLLVHTKCGLENGEITVIASGGTGELEYDLNGEGFDIVNHWEELKTGIYTITVRDENGCSASDEIVINNSDGPDFDVYITPAHCGLANGTIELDGFGGAGGYTYSFNGGPFGAFFTFSGKPSEFYVVAIKDAAGCIYEEEVFLWEQDGPEIDAVIGTDPACGQTIGIIELIADGIGILEYTISHPAGYVDSPIFNVPPGTYTVTAKDQWGCTASAVITINANPAPVITDIIVVNSTCGTNTGSLEIFVSGGITPYSYSLNNGPFVSSNTFVGLPAGSYSIIVNGANGCADSLDTIITSIGAQYSSVIDGLCPGEVYVLAGDTFTAPGVFSITLAAGASNGCDSIITLTLNPLDLQQQIISAIICENEIYTINVVDYSEAGQYVIDTISAPTGCDIIRTLDLQVNPLNTTFIDVTICNQGVYTINGFDYTLAGNYTIDTINSVTGCDSMRILRLEVEPMNTDTIVAEICEGDIYILNGINYTSEGIFLIDTFPGPNGCDTIISLDLTVNLNPIAGAGADQVLDCTFPLATLNGSATDGSVLWIGPGIHVGNENSLSPVVSLPGIYVMTVISGSGCQDTDSVIVSLDPEVVIADAGIDTFLSCDIDTVILQANPLGPNLIYQWSGPGINGTNEHLINPVITLPGIYTLVVTDTVSNCVSAPDQIIITDITSNIIAIIQASNGLDCFSTYVDLNATGSSVGPNIIYVWLNDQGEVVGNSPFVEVSSAGAFMFIVIDTLSGCFDEDTVFVEDLSVYPPVDAGDPQLIDCNQGIVTLNEGA
ncbi:MAG: hypothetical protein ABIQ11_03680, partial [Saprospiraceae bacterium]